MIRDFQRNLGVRQGTKLADMAFDLAQESARIKIEQKIYSNIGWVPSQEVQSTQPQEIPKDQARMYSLLLSIYEDHNNPLPKIWYTMSMKWKDMRKVSISLR